MNISVLAYRQKSLVFCALLLAMVAGVMAYFSLPAREDPEVTIREAVITTRYENQSAENIERLVTRPLEEAIVSLPELDEIRSTSLDGMSIIHVKVADKYSELDQIWDELAESVELAAHSLPANAAQPIVNDDFSDVSVMTLALYSSTETLHDLYDLAEQLRNTLVFIDGTRRVELHGIPEETIHIDIDEFALAAYDLSIEQVADSISASNYFGSIGALDSSKYSVLVTAQSTLNTIEDIARLSIPLLAASSTTPAGSIQLGDIADINRSERQPYLRAAFYNGNRAIVLAIAMQPEESVINYTKKLDSALLSLRRELPPNVNLDVVTKQSRQVEQAVYGVSNSVLQTLAIVLAVVVLFLGLRTGLIVGAIVPSVILVTLAIMGVFELQLERMSLATLVIALGLLVDNGIVVAEYFKRELLKTTNRLEIIGKVGKELSLPLLASTATTIVVFIPLMMAEHGSGEFTRNISLVILISLSVSWLLALTVTPILCALFMTSVQTIRRPRPSLFEKAEHAYSRALNRALQHKKSVLITATLMFFLGVLLVATTPAQFFPASDRTQLIAYLNTPAGSSTTVTEQAMQKLMKSLINNPQYQGVTSVTGYVGYGGPRFILSLTPVDPSPNAGFMLIDTDSMASKEQVLTQLRKAAPVLLPNTDFRISGMFTGPSDPTVMQIQIKGPDHNTVFALSSQLAALVTGTPQMIHTWSNWFNLASRLNVTINKTMATSAGITEAAIYNKIRQLLSGTVSTVVRQDDDKVPVVVRGGRPQAQSLESLLSATIPTESGARIPLEQLISLDYAIGFPRIEKEDGIPTVTIEGRNLRYSPEDLAPLLSADIEKLQKTLPDGYTIEFDGIIEDSVHGKAALAANFPLAICMIFLILVAQFKGVKRAIVVMLTIPLVVFGAGLGLTLMGASFGFIVILGLLALAGIIVNNAIVLIDRADIERVDNHLSVNEAVMKAAMVRMRPILITTITTIVGLLPLIIGKDVLFYAMACAIAFGLAAGTLLTLFVVPVLYTLLTQHE